MLVIWRYSVYNIITLCMWGQTDTAVVELGCLVGSHRDEQNHLSKRLSQIRSFTVARSKETSSWLEALMAGRKEAVRATRRVSASVAPRAGKRQHEQFVNGS